MQTLATSYAVNAQLFMRAMLAVDPTAKIGVPWAFDDSVPGAVIPYNSKWNDTVLKADGKYVSFVDAHYYDFTFGGSTGGINPTDEQVLRSLHQIPAVYDEMRSELNEYDPKASVVIGETGVSPSATTTTCTPVGALYAAGDVLSWLAAGAESVDWYDLDASKLNTTSRCINPAFGFFTSSSPPAPQTPYYGYLLAVAARAAARTAYDAEKFGPVRHTRVPVHPAKWQARRSVHQPRHTSVSYGDIPIVCCSLGNSADLELWCRKAPHSQGGGLRRLGR